MKLMNKHLCSVKRLLCLTAALVMTLALLTPVTAEAKTKNLNVKYLSTSNVSTVSKKATKVSKTGTYKIVQKKKNGWTRGYVKFVAPKTKKYKFTANNLRSDDGAYANDQVFFEQVYSYGRYQSLRTCEKMKVKGTKSPGYMFICSDTAHSSLPKSLTGTVKLKKGDVVYVRFLCLSSYHKKGTISFDLTIK